MKPDERCEHLWATQDERGGYCQACGCSWSPLWCDTCEGRGYVVTDVEGDAYAVQCPVCKDHRTVNEGAT
jgi:hypothetical protein